VHKFWGYVVFLAILLIIFQSVFFLAEYPMSWIEDTFSWLAAFTNSISGRTYQFTDFKRNYSGNRGIVVFAPQIGILLYFLYLLEDSGYMARVVFLMDRLLRPFGLNGKSIVPLVSGTACAIPAVISTRNIENVRKIADYTCNTVYDVFCKTSGIQYHYRTYYFRRNIFRNKI
jgi:ferrous iron transport protein B